MKLINHPVLCNYYVTYQCNAKCNFCDIWENTSGFADEEEVRINLIDLKKLKVKIIDFTGGEPLLHSKLFLFLEWAKKMDFITTVTTNGILYPKYAKLLKGKINWLHFSLDAFDENLHNEMRGVDCYNAVIESIKIALNLGERPDIIFTVTPQNINQIEEVYKKICIPQKLILILNPFFEYNKIKISQRFTEEDYNFLYLFSKKKNVYLNNALLEIRKNGGNLIQYPLCKSVSSTVVISPDNKLLLPCFHSSIEQIPISGNLYEIYKSEKILNYIKTDGKHSFCEGCHINCYLMPSFHTSINKYFWKTIPSTFKYLKEKYILSN